MSVSFENLVNLQIEKSLGISKDLKRVKKWLAVKKLVALGEDLSSLPNTPTWNASQLPVTPISRDPVPLMWGHLHSYVHTYTETDRQIHAYELKIKKK